MSRLSLVFAFGVATACAGVASAQSRGERDAARDPEVRRGVVSAPAPALNPAAAPSRPDVPFAGAERASDLAGSQSAMAAPVGPGSGMSFAFDAPSEINFAMGINQPQPGSFSTASGPEQEAVPEGVPPMLGADLAAVGTGDLPRGGLAPPSVTLGR